MYQCCLKKKKDKTKKDKGEKNMSVDTCGAVPVVDQNSAEQVWSSLSSLSFTTKTCHLCIYFNQRDAARLVSFFRNLKECTLIIFQ